MRKCIDMQSNQLKTDFSMGRMCLAITAISVFLLFLAGIAAAVNRGPSQIDVYGGSSGKVPFPHGQHQKRIQDCNVCHSVFPQKTDSIKKLKEKGALKPKKVMNLQCIRCHKAEKKAGQPTGPVTCKSCHKK